MLRIVFDLDDTICIAKNRDYVNAKPINETILKINSLKEEYGAKIIIHTSRGMVSCEGDIERIEKKNRKVTEQWLKDHCVPYDELVFGKPIADMYVDDKGINVKDFNDSPEVIQTLTKGGSGSKVLRICNIVRKDLKTDEECRLFKDWVAKSKEVDYPFKHPRIHSFLYNEVYMDYINGELLSDIINTLGFSSMFDKIVDFLVNPRTSKSIVKPNNLSESLCDVLNLNKGYDEVIDCLINFCKERLIEYEGSIVRHYSFFHGDFILSNLIYDSDSTRIYSIDPRNAGSGGSYLQDLAKLRMSLMGYEYIFGISEVKPWVGYLMRLDDTLKSMGVLNEVLVLNLMYILRLTRYKESFNYTSIKLMADEVLEELRRYEQKV